MSAAALVRKMVERGLTHEQALIALEVMEASDEERRADKREKNAERQRRHRASRNVTPVTRDERDTPAPLCPPDKESPTPKEITPPIPPRPEETPPRFADPILVLQSMVDPLTARNFADHCAQRRPRLTAQSAEGVIRVLRDVAAAGGNPVAALRLAMDRGWGAGFDVDWLRNAGLKLSALPAKSGVDWEGRVSAFQQDGTWGAAWGPKPGEPGCKAPAEVIARIAA